MIFSVPDHIEQIKKGKKTMTRRPTDRYVPDRLYAVQPGRGKPGISDGKILIIGVRKEEKYTGIFGRLTKYEAQQEGGYTPEDFEALYEEMYPGWRVRYAYYFEYFTTFEIMLAENDPDGMFKLYYRRKKMSKLGVPEIKTPEIHGIVFTPDKCIIKKWIDTGLIQDRYKCYLTDETCFCENIGCYWLEGTCKEKKEG